MSDDVYIAIAWIATFGSVGLYSAWVVLRGRKLSKMVPPDQRRWL